MSFQQILAQLIHMSTAILVAKMSNANKMGTMSRKQLDTEQLEDAKRLKQLFNEAKLARGFSQADAAYAMGYAGQSAVSQYLNGMIPLNLAALLRFADFLQVTPHEISPALSAALNSPALQPTREAASPLQAPSGAPMPPELAAVQKALYNAWKTQSLTPAALKAIEALVKSFPPGAAKPASMKGTPRQDKFQLELAKRLTGDLAPPKGSHADESENQTDH